MILIDKSAGICGVQRELGHVGESGCYLECIVAGSSLVNGLPFPSRGELAGKVLNAYELGVKEGWLTQDVFVSDPGAILGHLTGRTFSVTKVNVESLSGNNNAGAAMMAPGVKLVIANLKHKDRDHFVIVEPRVGEIHGKHRPVAVIVYDPLRGSEVTNKGSLHSVRIFKEG